jgi:hypothetical protein
MRTDLEITAFAASAGFPVGTVADGDLIGYARPGQVVDDPELSPSHKRALLAFWASDIHAVAGAPALRSLATGVTVGIDEIMAALGRLDQQVDYAALTADAGTAAAAR